LLQRFNYGGNLELFIARHGEDKGSKFEENERDLTKKGIRQAKRLGKRLKKFNSTHLYCSTLRRSKQTAIIVSRICRLEYEEVDIFKEQVSGNCVVDNLENRVFFKYSQSFNGGETYGELSERAENAWKWLVEKHREDSNDKVIIITHGRFMTFLVSQILGFEPNGFFLAIENCSYVIIKISTNWRPLLVLHIK